MTSFFHRGVTLLVTGGAILGSWAAMGANALALTQAQIAEQLQAIPVFILTNERGFPFIEPVPNGEEGTIPTIVTRVFISHEDAETSLESLQEMHPDLTETAQVTPLPLAKIYEMAFIGRGEENPLEFLLVPIVEEVQFAMSLVPESRPEYSDVPLFMVTSDSSDENANGDSSSNGEDEITLLTQQQGDEKIVPLFFRRDQFDSILESLSEENPEFVENMELQVIWLEDFISLLERADDDNAAIQQYQMIPLPESVDFAQSFIGSNRSNNGSAN
ncbi:MAG: Tic22 family protein [Cyanobacteria bacterium P01_F01_bin.150]